MPPKSAMKLKFHTATKLGTLVEFVALAVRGTITSTKISALCATYILEENQEKGTIEITIQNSKQRSAAEFGREMLQALCAISMTGCSELEIFGFNKNVPVLEFYEWYQSRGVACLSNSEPIDARANLTLDDLENIFAALSPSNQSIESLLNMPHFATIFPYANFIAGDCESLRHASGCEVLITTRKDGVVTAHRIDAPEPVSNIMNSWQHTSSTTAPVASLPTASSNIFDVAGYRGCDESRWRISKMLGAVPSDHKERVFSWAADAIYSVDDFHNTHGGVNLPESFRYHIGDVHITADRDLKFQME